MATLWAWGLNDRGQLADGTSVNKSSPVQAGLDSTWRWCGEGGGWVAGGIKNDNTLWMWGGGNAGELGDGTVDIYRSSPVQIGALLVWDTLSTGDFCSTAKKLDGTLWSWGKNTSGELGDGTLVNKCSPVQTGGDTDWSQAARGDRHGLAIKTDGTLWAWGVNTDGQLGLGDSTNRSSPEQVGALTSWSHVQGGGEHSVAIKVDGTLWTWGRNTNGQLGDGTTNLTSSPIQVGLLTDWAYAGCGSQYTVATKTDGTLWAWGVNTDGQLGQGDTTPQCSPVQVGALTNWAKRVAGGSFHVAALKTDGTLWTWGRNLSGQLGQGDSTNTSSPVQVGLLTDWMFVGAGPKQTRALRFDGATLDDIVLEWGAVGPTAYYKYLDLDAVLAGTKRKTIDLDALLKFVKTEDVNLDALLKFVKSETLDLDALLKAVRDETLDIDAILTKVGIQTITLDVDAILRALITTGIDLDALLKFVKSETLDLDALLKFVKIKDIDFDAILKYVKSEILDVTSDIYDLIGWAWGQSTTSYVEIPEIWSKWKDSEGNPATYDSIWGVLQLGIGDTLYSDVRDFGDATEKWLEITIDKYGSGTGTQGDVYWRGSASPFDWDAGSPSWEEYTTATAKSWRYVQVRVSK